MSETTPEETGPRRRGDHARRRIRQAALDVLAEQGMAGFGVEAVARRAGAAKTTVYRHWPSAEALLVDAMDVQFRPFVEPDSGDLRTDLVRRLTELADMLSGSRFPALLAAYIDAAERVPALRTAHARLTEQRREPLRRVLRTAVDRGELAADCPIDLVVDLLAAPLFYRRFVAHRALEPDLPATLVDSVLPGLRGGAAFTGAAAATRAAPPAGS